MRTSAPAVSTPVLPVDDTWMNTSSHRSVRLECPQAERGTACGFPALPHPHPHVSIRAQPWATQVQGP